VTVRQLDERHPTAVELLDVGPADTPAKLAAAAILIEVEVGHWAARNEACQRALLCFRAPLQLEGASIDLGEEEVARWRGRDRFDKSRLSAEALETPKRMRARLFLQLRFGLWGDRTLVRV